MAGAAFPACACPDGTLHHCLLFLNGPTVIEAWSPALCPFCYAPRFMVLLPLMGATRNGCFLDRTNVCEPPHLCHSPKRRAHDWPAGPRTSDCLPLGSPLGGTGTAGLVPGGPPCLWCCHLSWVCLRPSACWKCPPSRTPIPAPPGVTSLVQSTCPALSWFQRAAVLCFLRPPGMAFWPEPRVFAQRGRAACRGRHARGCPWLFRASPLGSTLEIWRKGSCLAVPTWPQVSQARD